MSDDGECRETASAPTDHYAYAETFGHVCRKFAYHPGHHECACGSTWGNADTDNTATTFL